MRVVGGDADVSVLRLGAVGGLDGGDGRRDERDGDPTSLGSGVREDVPGGVADARLRDGGGEGFVPVRGGGVLGSPDGGDDDRECLSGGVAAAALSGWRRLPGPLKLVTALVAFSALLLAVSAVTGGDKEKVTQAAVRPARTPEACLSRAGLAQVSQVAPTTWRAFHSYTPFFGVFVDRMASSAAAVKASGQADLVWSETAGRYLVTGPSTGTDDQGVVDAVAACLTP